MTATARIIDLLDRNGAMSTAELCRAMALPSRRVWGLLKSRVHRGEVLRSDGLFALNRELPPEPPEISAAIRLLQRRGYVVRRVEAGLCECDHDPSADEWHQHRCATCGKELE